MQLLSNPNYYLTFYEPSTGKFYRVFEIQEHDKRLNVMLSSTGDYTWRGTAGLAWEFISGSKVPKNHSVMFKDMNSENLKSSNLGVIPQKELKAFRSALHNLKGGLKIIPDKREVYTYKVKFKEAGTLKTRCFHDLIAATDFYNTVMQKSIKEVGRYSSCV